jgi:hypothetical protein
LLSRVELLERIEGAWTAFRASFAGLDEAAVVRPGPEGWSVKDHIAHVRVWERIVLVAHMQGRSFAEAGEMDEATSRATEHMRAETGLRPLLRA